MAQRNRFDGAILGAGTASGTRLVIGMWPSSPYGFVVDAMVERADGHRILLAPNGELAGFIRSTYTFDEVRIEPTSLTIRRDRWTFTADSLQAEVDIGRRTAVGTLLDLLPRSIARTRAWCRLIDPIASRMRPGVHTVGTAGGGRREYYCALDEHTLAGFHATWEGAHLGSLRDIDPPVRFGFGSTPRSPSLVRVTTFVDV